MGSSGGKRTRSLAGGAAYGVLVLPGAVEGFIGSFQYSHAAGPVPLAALLACLVILATCLLASWAVRSAGGALMPAIGFILASFVLSMPVSHGSVIITDTTAGKWFLYGGTLSAVLGVAVSFGGWTRARPR